MKNKSEKIMNEGRISLDQQDILNNEAARAQTVCRNKVVGPFKFKFSHWFQRPSKIIDFHTQLSKKYFTTKVAKQVLKDLSTE